MRDIWIRSAWLGCAGVLSAIVLTVVSKRGRLLYGVVGLWAGITGAEETSVKWKRVQIDARFRSEGVAVGDLNQDGKTDVVAGDLWYAAPEWTPHEIRKPGDYWAGQGYSNSFCNWTHDLNGDGWLDVVIVGFPGEPFHWYENPQGKDGHWKEHMIWHSICNESPQFTDLTGDGQPEFVLGSQPEQQMGYLEIPKGDAVYQKWSFTPVSLPGDPATNGTFKYYHGLGVTDLNGDGRNDVVIPHGWWEQPATREMKPWVFHEHRLSNKPEGGPLTGADIHSDDLDLDGDRDLIMSSAHQHGLWWFANGEKQSKPGMTGQTVNELFSQTHALLFVDVNGDGKKDLVTGKRYYAHNGGDPGANDPVVMYWYEIERKAEGPVFVPHEIVAGRDTGIGTQFTMADVNGDGLLDIALSNKKGVNLLLQVRE